MMATGDCEIHAHENALATMICSTLLAKCEWKLKAVFGGGGCGEESGDSRSVVAAGPPATMCFSLGPANEGSRRTGQNACRSLAKLELLLANPFAPRCSWRTRHRNLSAATEGTNAVPSSSTASHHRLNHRPLPYAHTT